MPNTKPANLFPMDDRRSMRNYLDSIISQANDARAMLDKITDDDSLDEFCNYLSDIEGDRDGIRRLINKTRPNTI